MTGRTPSAALVPLALPMGITVTKDARRIKEGECAGRVTTRQQSGSFPAWSARAANWTGDAVTGEYVSRIRSVPERYDGNRGNDYPYYFFGKSTMSNTSHWWSAYSAALASLCPAAISES